MGDDLWFGTFRVPKEPLDLHHGFTVIIIIEDQIQDLILLFIRQVIPLDSFLVCCRHRSLPLVG